MDVVSVIVNGWPTRVCVNREEIDAAVTVAFAEDPNADVLLHHREAEWFEALTNTERAA